MARVRLATSLPHSISVGKVCQLLCPETRCTMIITYCRRKLSRNTSHGVPCDGIGCSRLSWPRAV